MRRLLGLLLPFLARLIVRTLRVRFVGADPASLPHPCVYAFLHGLQVPLLRFPRPRTGVLSSLSADGRVQARVMRGFGFEVIDGSSSRGGARALAGALRLVGRGLDVAVAVDGPRGPRGVVKPGVVYVASRAGAPVVPLSSACARAWRSRRSWDGFALPRPFSRVVVAAGEPLSVPPGLPPSGEAFERERRLIEARLATLSSEALQAVVSGQ